PRRSAGGRRSMRIGFDVTAGRISRVSTPILLSADAYKAAGGYRTAATSRLYPGMKVIAAASVGKVRGDAVARLFVRRYQRSADEAPVVDYGPVVKLTGGKKFKLRLELANSQQLPVTDLGIEIRGKDRAEGELFVDSVSLSGRPEVSWPAELPRVGEHIAGWLIDADSIFGNFRGDRGPELMHIGKNSGRGILITGNTDWRDYSFEARMSIHLAEAAGIAVRYQGLQRYLALVKRAGSLQLVLRYYEDIVLDETECDWDVDEPHLLRLVCKGKTITAWCDGRKVLEGRDDKLGCGGAGLIFERGIIGFRDMKVR
ncbi:MAG: hypothetical protein J7M14_01675, partial [Planctomycetes bacterium]|nr:hypothetical protein [Planctomycetota bacterium]